MLGPALAGLFLVPGRRCARAIPEGAFLLLGSWCARASPERASFIVHWQALACGEREATIVVPPPACDSAVVPCFHDRPVFLCRHSLLWISSLPSPQSVSPQPTAVLALGLFSNPTLQLPAPFHTCEHTSQSGAHMAVVQTICISHSVPSATDCPLHPLPAASNAFLLSQSISLSERGFPPIRESLLCFSSPAPGCRSRPASSPPPSPFFIPSYPVMQGSLVLSSVQDLLLVFSQCSVRIVASIGVFLMHPWREMNSMSSYSSTILNLHMILICRGHTSIY